MCGGRVSRRNAFGHPRVSRHRSALLLAVAALTLLDSALAAPVPCTAQLGDVVDFGACNPVSLPGLEVRFVDVSQPDEGVPLTCWNYEASAGTGSVKSFRHCHNGELGGDAVLTVDGSDFTIFFDVASGCVRSPGGAWAPALRGHTFHAGAIEPAARVAYWEKQSEHEMRCSARRRSG
jgi:hypothetical protein